MLAFKIFLGSVVLAFSGVAWAEDSPSCTAYDGDNYYDLNPLQAKKDYEITTDLSSRKFTLNVCRNVVTELWNVNDAENVAAFYRGEHGDVSIGSVNQTLRITDGHPLLLLTNGSPCPNNAAQRASTALRFICDTSVFSTGQPQLMAQLPPDDESACAYFIEWRTHVACPTSRRTGAGGFVAVFAAILLIAIVAYLVAGTLYNRFALGLRGMDQIPRISFFSFSDTMDFLKRITESCRGGSRPRQWGSWGERNRYSGFGRLAAEEEESIAHGRFSLEDEDEDEPPLPPLPPKNGQNGNIRLS